MKKRHKIFVFRHGRSTYNVKGIFTGWMDPRLTLRGKWDAFKVARKLRREKIHVAFESDLIRAKQTLKIVLRYHPECKKIIDDKRLRERSYGILEGTSHKQFVKEIGKQAYNLRAEGDAIENLNPRLRKRVEKFFGEQEFNVIHRGYNVKVPGGESFADVEKRVKSFIKYLKSYIKKYKVNVAISGHGNSIRLFRKIMERVSQDESIKWFIPYDKVYEYKV